MRILPLLVASAAAYAASEIPTEVLWTSLAAKRDALSRVHQEFEVSQTSTFATGNAHRSKRQSIVDLAPGQWREQSVSGSGDRVRIFDGKNLFIFEDGGEEFIRAKRKANAAAPLPQAYQLYAPDWRRAKEIERLGCNLAGLNHQCVVLEIPLKPDGHGNSGDSATRLVHGLTRVAVDLETGLLVSSRTVQVVANRTGGYKTEILYTLKKLSYGGPAAGAKLFELPFSGMTEVKELGKWNAAKIKKRLAGQPAPELAVVDIKGNPLTLAEFKGKTILLDFWTTWCPPCRADAPSLDKLYKKYGEKNLAIVGISVSEDRSVVEKFLADHPHSYPIVLTTENEMPRPYQIGVFPTYIVIDPDGTVAAAVEGNQGFGELRKLLKKAGLEVD